MERWSFEITTFPGFFKRAAGTLDAENFRGSADVLRAAKAVATSRVTAITFRIFIEH
jgi:hypothetical protein